MLAVYQPLLGALRANLSPGALAGFLEYASVRCEDSFEDPFRESDDVAAGLNASVVGRWVWCDPYQQPGRDREALDRALRGAGFGFSGRRQSFYHTCGVSSARQPGDKRRGGKLERFHGVTSAADYPAGHDPRPGWKLAKDAKAKARRKRS